MTLTLSLSYGAAAACLLLATACGTPGETPDARAQAVTIGGGPAGARAEGVLGMFVGNRFENFRNMARFVPTSTVQTVAEPTPLPRAERAIEFAGEFMGERLALPTFLARSNTSAFLVLKDGAVVFEQYLHGDTPESQHISFSVAKSFTSALIGIAIHEGFIGSVDDSIRQYLPELTSATFDDVRIEHVLQMSSGLQFDENYSDPDSDINKMIQLVQTMSYLEYINTLERAHEPGTFNHYASVNTQLLGILLTRVTGKSLTAYTEEKLWRPMQAEQPAAWMLDEQSYELAMGGLAASARDYARLGLLYLNKGRAHGRQVIPETWVETSVTPDEPHLMPGDNPNSSNTAGYMYQWWTPRRWDGDFLARGIWGQTIYVHPRHRVVIVKLAADQKNFSKDFKLAYIDYIQELAQSMRD